MRTDVDRGGRKEAGVSAVEFGLILPLFMVLVLGIMDYGWVYFTHLNMTNAAREGARVGAATGVTSADTALAETAAETTAGKYLTAAGLAGTVDAVPPAAGNQWTVTVNVTVNPFNPLIGFVPTPPSLGASAAMRWELAQ